MRKILGNLGSDERHTFQAEFGNMVIKDITTKVVAICIVQLW